MGEINFEKLVGELSSCSFDCDSLNLIDGNLLPNIADVSDFANEVLALMFPNVLSDSKKYNLIWREKTESLFLMLKKLLESTSASDPEQKAKTFLYSLKDVKCSLIKDAIAMYNGDPAATSPCEVIICYPGFYAIAMQRMAHTLFNMKIPYIPRMITEYAHGKTGIDIHPGAKIGESFCIDHGTGVVIGETAEIGNNVKIYQGVTIGAKSFKKDVKGNLIKNTKRHPTIGNECIIYAGATILGGDTVIGDGCVIGGNVWLTSSLPPGEKIYYDPTGNKK